MDAFYPLPPASAMPSFVSRVMAELLSDTPLLPPRNSDLAPLRRLGGSEEGSLPFVTVPPSSYVPSFRRDTLVISKKRRIRRENENERGFQIAQRAPFVRQSRRGK